ncbi:GcrA family cell cycle regulator [Brevundimonas sp. P7753]|uniref:GcrA family cell cycle regulator n=1 Tax=Brevundimonas sp. P7753 TaxID=2726982 RepID=UPI0015BC203C|nr:GcrA family cell cycle regulator [Brevundimonas sp. P7753]NWE53932.1 GcrA cell cycle regulator [Brevundimonas sp. P7753]
MTKSAWTDERVDRLKTLWLEGRTADEIARELQNGISRSAVLGKVHRLGLSAGRPGRAPAGFGSQTPRRRVERPVAKPVKRATGRPSVPADRRPDLPSWGMTILTVTRGQCRWPYGDPAHPGFSLCGRPVARGAFCLGHAAVGYRTLPGGAPSLLSLAGLV